MYVFGCDPEGEAPASLLSLEPGAKAENLVRLSEAGFNVPPFFVLPASAFRFVLQQSPLVCEMMDAVRGSDVGNRKRFARDLRAAIAGCEWPAALVKDFGDAVNRLHSGLDSKALNLLAVRSSVAGQIREDCLLPGRHESFLFVEGIHDAIANAKRVWASAFNDQVLDEQMRCGADLSEIAMGVIIQRMVDPLISGVCYTSNPKTGCTREMVVSTLWGAGNSSASADIACDTFTFDKRTHGYHPDIADKKRFFRRDDNSSKEYREGEVKAGDRTKATLNEDELNVVALTALEVESSCHRPQSVEFCFDKQRRLVILQSQTLPQEKQVGPALGNRIEWGLTKSLQGCAGVTCPMTFSVYQKAFSLAGHSLEKITGVAESRRAKQRNLIKNMLGLIQGRIYLNLEACEELCRSCRGTNFPPSVIQSVLGLGTGSARTSLQQATSPHLGAQRTAGVRGLFNRLRMAVGVGWEHFCCRLRWSRNRQKIGDFLQESEAWEFNDATPRELMQYLDELAENLTTHGQTLFTNQLLTAAYLRGLNWMSENWAPRSSSDSTAELRFGLESELLDEREKLWAAMVAEVRDDPQLRQEIAHGDCLGMAARIAQEEAFSRLNNRVDQFLERWGHWGVAGYKLEDPSFCEAPDWVYRVLRRKLLESEERQPEATEPAFVERQMVRSFERQVLPQIGFSLLPRKLIFRHCISAVKAGQKFQADFVDAKMKFCDRLRKILQSLGAQWASEGVIERPEDIFYLKLSEVEDFVMGRAVSADPSRSATSRRVEFAQFTTTPPPAERFETWGCVYQGNDFSGGDN